MDIDESKVKELKVSNPEACPVVGGK